MNTQLSDHIKIAPGFWEGLRQVGIDPFDVARTAGMPGTIINEPEVSPARYFSIWAAFSDLMGDTAEGIVKLATAFQTSQYPPTVLATYHASDYRAALKRMVRYKRLCLRRLCESVSKARNALSSSNGCNPPNLDRPC